MIDDIQLGVKAKQLVDAVETAGVLAKGADRLSSEQLARYFIRAFKNKQLGVETPGIKTSQVVSQKPKPSRSHGSAEPLQSLQRGSAHHCLPAGSAAVPTCLASVALKHRPSMTGM